MKAPQHRPSPKKGVKMQKLSVNSNRLQPLEVALLDHALLKIDTVTAITGLSKTTIYTRMAEDPPTFPKSIRQGKRCTRWRAGEIREFLQSLSK
jgi:prophage regulatory protein